MQVVTNSIFTVLFLSQIGIGNSWSETRFAVAEATIQGGSAAFSNINETATGYLQVKYHAPLTLARKIYFQFNLSGSVVVTNQPAQFQIFFKNSYQQRIQLWGLNQFYPAFNPNLSWNNAKANETTSNALLTNGTFTGSRIGNDMLVPTSGTMPFSFTIPHLSDFLFQNKLTLVLSGVDDALNNGSGLRLIANSATLTFVATNPPVSDTNHYDVYLVSGQSNMDGRGYTNNLTGPIAFWNQPQTNVQIYYANPINNDPINPTYNTGWRTLVPGFCIPPGFSDPLPSPRFGPELSFAKTISEANPNRRIALIKVSKGGTSLSGNWKPSSGYMFATLTNIVRVALNELTAQGRTYTVRGMIWHQGESDSSGTSLANYETNMTQLIAAIRRDLGITNLPFVIGEVATNKVEALRAAQFRLLENIPYVGFASADSLQTFDETHFISESVLILGERFAAGIETPSIQFVSAEMGFESITLHASGLAKSSCLLLTATNATIPLSQWKLFPPTASIRKAFCI